MVEGVIAVTPGSGSCWRMLPLVGCLVSVQAKSTDDHFWKLCGIMRCTRPLTRARDGDVQRIETQRGGQPQRGGRPQRGGPQKVFAEFMCNRCLGNLARVLCW